MRAHLSLLLAVLLVSASFAAGECPDADNLLGNCGLESGLSPWQAQFNSFVARSTSDSFTGSASLAMEMEGLSGHSNWSARSECVVLAADQTYRFGGWYRYRISPEPNLCQTQLRVTAGTTDCSGSATFLAAPQVVPVSEWLKSESTHTASASGDSAQIHIRCQGGSAGSTILVDDLFVGLDSALERRADLTITVDNGLSSVTAGTSATYTIVVANVGPEDAIGAAVTGTFPVEFGPVSWTCSATGTGSCAAAGSGDIAESVDLAVGDTTTFVAVGTVSPAASGGLTVSAGVAAPAGVVDGDPSDDSAGDTDAVDRVGDLAVGKQCALPVMVPGAGVTYTITATNAGPSNASGGITDIFPAGLSSVVWSCVASSGSSCSSGSTGDITDVVSLLAGGAATYTAVGVLGAGVTTTITNTATVAIDFGQTDPVDSNDSSLVATPVQPTADVVVAKTNGVDTLVPGTAVTYTVTVTNTGPSDISATVTDTLPIDVASAFWTCAPSPGSSCGGGGSGSIDDAVSMLVGGTVSYTIAAEIDAAAIGNLANTAQATVTSPGIDPDPLDNSDTDTDTLSPTADLSIDKDDGVRVVAPGDAVTYTVVASNHGPSDVVGAVVSDVVTPLLAPCSWGCVPGTDASCNPSPSSDLLDFTTLAAGASVTYTGACTVGSAATITVLHNTATIDPPPGVLDPNLANNSDDDSDLGPSIFTDGFESGNTDGWSTDIVLSENCTDAITVSPLYLPTTSYLQPEFADFDLVSCTGQIFRDAVACFTPAASCVLSITGRREAVLGKVRGAGVYLSVFSGPCTEAPASCLATAFSGSTATIAEFPVTGGQTYCAVVQDELPGSEVSLEIQSGGGASCWP